jgi:hypothetical protein
MTPSTHTGGDIRYVTLSDAWDGKPAVAIIITIEDPLPIVLPLGESSEHDRTLTWILSQPRLLALLSDAIDQRLDR